MVLKEFCHSLLWNGVKLPSFDIYRKTTRREKTYLDRSANGVSFHRIIGTFPEHSQFLLELEDSSNHCHDYDEFGSNDCHFNWQEEAIGNFSTAISKVLDETSFIEAHVLLEGHIPYKLHCALCGQPCEVGLPIIDFKYTFRMPACPVELTNHFQDFRFQLWSHSPTDGLVSISLEGSAIVYSAPTEILAEFEVVGTIR
jgi:hypothetical protein